MAESNESRAARYWRANVRLLLGLMSIWFIVSYGFGVLLVDALNAIPFFGFKLGFWWAQQGAIYVFIALIFYYCWRMARIEREFGMDEPADPADDGTHQTARDSEPGDQP